jgi:hypothetical protein
VEDPNDIKRRIFHIIEFQQRREELNEKTRHTRARSRYPLTGKQKKIPFKKVT